MRSGTPAATSGTPASRPPPPPPPPPSARPWGAPAEGNALAADPEQPLLNRATAAAYPPGSAFKVLVAVAGLEAALVTPATRVPPLTPLPPAIHPAGRLGVGPLRSLGADRRRPAPRPRHPAADGSGHGCG